MRRKDKEITNKAEIIAILDKCSVLRLAMCRDNQPYIVPVCFATAEKDGVVELYIHSAAEGKKIEYLLDNNRICFEADTGFEVIAAEDACRYSAGYQSIIGSGQAEFVCDCDAKKHALDIIMQRYAGHGSYNYKEASLGRIAVIKITVWEICGKRSG